MKNKSKTTLNSHNAFTVYYKMSDWATIAINVAFVVVMKNDCYKFDVVLLNRNMATGTATTLTEIFEIENTAVKNALVCYRKRTRMEVAIKFGPTW